MKRKPNDVEQKHICMMSDCVQDKKDVWLIYELCPGKTLNELLFDVKGEFYKGERLYKVHHGAFYHDIRNNTELLRDFMKRMADALTLLGKLSIVHGDLKPDNIIVDYEPREKRIKSLKLIDLGSSFLLNPEGQVLDS